MNDVLTTSQDVRHQTMYQQAVIAQLPQECKAEVDHFPEFITNSLISLSERCY